MKIRYSELKKLIYEASSPLEQDMLEPDDSLDDQVDRYLAEYENEAKSAKKEGLDFRALTRRLISEADEEPPPAESPDQKPGIDNVDVAAFANSVVRLIDNYDSLLEVRSAIARRAINFIAKSYSIDVVDALKNSFKDDHGIVPGKTKDQVDSEEFSAPAADRAGDGGAGAPGGGGIGG